MNYTPGEWKAGYNPCVTGPTTPSCQPVCGRDWPYRTINVGTETIAIVPAQDGDRTHVPNTCEMEANANLIAAAPEMYEACVLAQLALTKILQGDEHISDLVITRAGEVLQQAIALAKAERGK